MKTRLLGLGALAAAAALSLSACGGSSGTATPAPSPTAQGGPASIDELTSKAGLICGERPRQGLNKSTVEMCGNKNDINDQEAVVWNDDPRLLLKMRDRLTSIHDQIILGDRWVIGCSSYEACAAAKKSLGM